MIQQRRGVSAYTLPEASSKQDGPNTTFALNGEFLPNSSNFLNLKVTGYNGRDDYLPYNGTTPRPDRRRLRLRLGQPGHPPAQ